ncbi:hypothetical protein BT96DRAFT_945605 [Gymnopus androsaceus JB14]|uniref:DUF6534 domain-containing protein n=1 Tax=Gymnopus androsaceus JB14 TaxID=1447944 RepID=A0A6A4GYZ8_9AGAR|nr:hypothetical protein BT96DRAFT_945605 [Gymnopus androsaceus JB14]
MSGQSSLQSLENQTVDNTLGAALLGIVGATFLFGITTLQVYLYYHHYGRDSRLHKVAVAALWILDSLHLVLIVHAVYHYAVKGFGDTLNLAVVIWSVKLQVTINVIIILFVQSLYAYRVWILGGYHHGVFGYIVAGVVVGGFALAYKIYTIQTFQELQTISWAIDSSLATSTAIDFTIALAMCLYLHKSRGSESRLNSRISTVMQYSLSSGLFTSTFCDNSACSLSTLFTYTLMPNTLIFLGLQFLSTKLYVGSFLAMLNARQRRPGGPGNDQASSNAKHGIEFRVQTSTFTHSISDFDSRSQARWQNESSSSRSSCPQSPADSLQSHSTYVSFDSSKKSAWDIEAAPAVAMVHPLTCF